LSGLTVLSSHIKGCHPRESGDPAPLFSAASNFRLSGLTDLSDLTDLSPHFFKSKRQVAKNAKEENN